MKFLSRVIVAAIALNSLNGQGITNNNEYVWRFSETKNSIYTKPSVENRNPNPPYLSNKKIDLTPTEDTESCECVPYYLCINGTLCSDGCGIIDLKIRNRPCTDYLMLCCKPEDQLTKPTESPIDRHRPKGCGIRNPDGVDLRITGDTDNESQFAEFPWMVAVLREDDLEEEAKKFLTYQCGGSLIHPQVVLTAAHCVIETNKRFQIRAGEWDTQTMNEKYPHHDRAVVDIITHPGYNSGALFNDIALLVLDRPLAIAPNIDTVCLPPQDENFDHYRCYASGWGKNVFEQDGQYQVILKKIDMPVIPRGTCQEQLRNTRLGRFFILDKSFICAGGELGKDTCKGDGGSPLVCPVLGSPRRYYQSGIVAWGIQCGRLDVPGTYANVALFRNWIDENMNRLGYGTSYYTYNPVH